MSEEPATGTHEAYSNRGDRRTVIRIVITLVCTLLLNGFYTTWAVTQSQHNWCDTVQLIARQQPPSGNPVTNPARGFDQKLHTDFLLLESRLGC
jgi:hypothetical protein